MCGISAVISPDEDIYDDLFTSILSMQHRGQDGSGTAVLDTKVQVNKKLGLVDNNYKYSKGKMGIGHNRYRTVGECTEKELQPLKKSDIYLVHNGTVTFPTPNPDNASDSEFLLQYVWFELSNPTQENITFKNICNNVAGIYYNFRGGFSVIVMTNSGIFAFRDLHGIRPLVIGRKLNSYMLASESCALTDAGYSLTRDVIPGEVVFVDTQGTLHSKIITKALNFTPCIFEYIYLARADSIINKIAVYKTRLNMAKKFAEKIKRLDLDIDIVVPIPDTSSIFAIEIAKILGKDYVNGLLRNRYVGRTFILPENNERQKMIRRKFSVIKQSVEGKNILLVDDSIVRGNTCKHVIKILKDNKTKKIFMASCSPPVYNTNEFGIHIPTQNELITYQRTLEEVKEHLGCDELIYQDLDDLEGSILMENSEIDNFEKSIFVSTKIWKTQD